MAFNLDDPSVQWLMATGLGLLGGGGTHKTSFGQDLSRSGLLGMQAYGQAQQSLLKQQADERANRANDLQQAMGALSFLRQQDMPKILAAAQSGQGGQYTPDPLIQQLTQRIGTLSGLPNLSGKPGAPIQQQPPPLPAPQASQYSPAVRPEYQAQGPMPQAKPSQPLQAGGVPMEAWLAVDPTGKLYMEQLAKDRAPIVLRQGDLVKQGPDGNYGSVYQQPPTIPGILPQRNPQGQVTAMSEAPGFSDAASRIKAAETGAVKGAEAPYQIHMVPTASGATLPMSTAQLVGGRGVLGSVPGASPVVPQIPPQAARLDVTQPSKQDPWADLPMRYKGQGLGQSTFDKSMDENYAKTAYELSQKYGTNADLANSRKAINAQAQDLVDKSDTGFGATRIADIKNILTTRFGIPESSFAETPSATIALNKDLINAAVSRAKQMYGSRMTQSEAMLQIQRAAPNTEMPKAAIKFLLSSDSALADYQINQTADFGKYVQRGGDPQRFEGWYAQKFPATNALSGIQLGKPSIDDLVNRYRTNGQPR